MRHLSGLLIVRQRAAAAGYLYPVGAETEVASRLPRLNRLAHVWFFDKVRHR
jgi:hypothetical protein